MKSFESNIGEVAPDAGQETNEETSDVAQQEVLQDADQKIIEDTSELEPDQLEAVNEQFASDTDDGEGYLPLGGFELPK